jgi:hypothetical protein
MMKYFCILLITLLSSVIHAGPAKSVADTKTICDRIASASAAKNFDRVFEIVSQYMSLPKEEVDASAYQMRTQLSGQEPRLGNLFGFEHVATQRAGESFLVHTYLMKFELSLLALKCTWYKPREVWVMEGMTWSDDVSWLPLVTD